MRRRSGFGWLELITGIVLILLGIWALVNPVVALKGMAFVYGVVAVVMGIADILLYIQVERYTGLGPILALIAGILSVMSGVMLLVYPRTGAVALALLFPTWFVAHCISRLAHANHIRLVSGDGMYYFTLIVNIIGLILGCMMFLSPMFTLTYVRLLASAYLILLGVDSILTAIGPLGMRH